MTDADGESVRDADELRVRDVVADGHRLPDGDGVIDREEDGDKVSDGDGVDERH